MRIGLNLIAPQTLPIIKTLIAAGQADFCEIMLDNVIHLPADEVWHALADIPLAIHIVASRFSEREVSELQCLGNKLKKWLSRIKPMYVSDHLVCFMQTPKRYHAIISEWDYERDYKALKERICLWQDLLDQPLLLENHASITQQGVKQPEFFTRLLQETSVKMLFDFSNAYIAEQNGVIPVNAWSAIYADTQHFHLGGFRYDKTTGIALDTHDAPISAALFPYVKAIQNSDKTLVIECDATANLQQWQAALTAIKTSAPEVLSQPLPLNDSYQSVPVSLLETNQHSRLTKHAPLINEALPATLLKRFLSESVDSPNDWREPLVLLNFLAKEDASLLTEALVKDLLKAAAIRWSLTGFLELDADGIILASPYLKQQWVGLIKNKNLTENFRLFTTFKKNANICGYAIFKQPLTIATLQWQALDL